MKRYKLLKDLPFVKAGEILEIYHSDDKKYLHIFNENKEEIYQLKIGYNVAETHNEWFKEIKESEEYFYITTDGFVYFAIKGKDKELEINRKAIGNYFETKEEAKKYLGYLKAKEVIKQDAKGYELNSGDYWKRSYFCYYSYENKNICINYSQRAKRPDIYFESEEDIKESLKNHPEEWKIYLTYEQ